jgi:hypothetical protein
MHPKTLSLAVLALCALLPTAPAQQSAATVTGIVSDSSGGTLANAALQLTNLQTQFQFTTRSNGAGYYAAPGLLPGEYRITAELTGFKKAVRSPISLAVDQHAAIDLTLEIGDTTQTVQVTEEVPLVETGSATLGKVVETRRIQDLPLNGRNPLALALFTPGVRTSVGPSYSGFADRGVRISTMSINNSPGGLNDQLLDGNHNTLTWIGEVAVPLGVDSVQEFKVQSGPMPAEYGYTAGGVVNLVSRSGTNALHGTLYEFLRNDRLDGRNAFAPERERLRFNQFGGAVGGAIRRDQSFFFFNHEQYLVRQGSPRIGTVPVAAERAGDYSATRDSAGRLIPIYDPATTAANAAGAGEVRRVFPGNLIPSSRLDTASRKILDITPLPNRTPSNAFTNSDNYQTIVVPTTDSSQYNGRVDHRFGDRNTLMGRVSWFEHIPFQKQVIFPGEMFGRKDVMANKNIALSDVHAFSPTLIHEFRIGAVRQAFTFADASLGGDWPRKFGLPDSVPNDVMPRLSVAGYTMIGYGTTGKRGSLNWNFQDMVTTIRGNHTLKIGGEHRLLRGDNRQIASPSGLFTFTSALTGDIQRPAGTGSSLASFVLGSVRQATIDVAQGVSMKAYATTFFLQDDWKFSRRLSLNLGLRYDFQQQPYERHDRLMNFDLDGRSAASGLRGRAVYAGVAGQPREWSGSDANDFGPRVGFAWDVLGNATTVFRGGYGIFYPSNFYNANFGSAGTGFASMTTTYLPTGGNFNFPAFDFQKGFPTSPIQPLGVAGGDDAFLGQAVKLTESGGRSPMAQQWSASLQHQLPGRWLIDASYAGNKGGHFMSGSWDLNQLHPSNLDLGRALLSNVPNPYAGRVPGSLGAATLTRLQALRPYPYYSAVTVVNPRAGNYISHLFLLTVEKKTAHGLTLLFSFTGGKLISDSLVLPQSDFGENSARESAYQNGAYNRRAERSVDPQDVSRRAVVSSLYELPIGPGHAWNPSSALLRHLAGGWQIGAIGTMQTGLPIAVTGANNQLATRPNSTGQSAASSNPTASAWFNTSVFVNPPDFTFGNVSRALPDVRSPGSVNWDLSLMKNTRLTERVGLQFRAEAFNVLNHVNYGQPNTTFVPGTNGLNSSGSFGVISSARDPRQVQLGLKLHF